MTLAFVPRRVVVLWPVVLLISLSLLSGVTRLGYAYIRGAPVPPKFTVTAAGMWITTPMNSWEIARHRTMEAFSEPWFPLQMLQWSKADAWRFALETWAAPLATLAASLATGLTLMTLTTSRRICGIKGGHILRAMTYRLAPIPVLYVLWCLQWFTALSPAPFGRGAGAWVLLLVVLGCWGVWWWRTVFARGWLMPRTNLLAFLLGTVDVLAAAVAYFLMSPYSAGLMLI